MFDKIAKYSDISNYLEVLIKKKYKETGDQRFKNVRQFCIAYLEEEGIEPAEDEVRKMTNHMSGMKNENKPIRLKDLPIFTKLLDVSCEDILSAGKVRSYNENHITNYKLAASRNEKLWQSYINNEAEFLLNPDEYDKTILDYAFEFKNYPLLKYLIDNEYIWFVEQNPGERCGMGFYGGTSIKRRPLGNSKIMEAQLTENDSLRRKMIVLAIEKSDIDMLDELRAREIPPMYQLKTAGNPHTDFEKFYDTEMVEALSKADEAVLDYFSKEITVITSFKNTPQKYMFPSIGILLEKLIANKNKCTEAILNRCIEHNRNTYVFVKEIVERQIDYYHRCYFDYFKDGNIISVLDSQRKFRDDVKDGIVTNIIKVNSQSDSFVISNLIHELNKCFDDILALNPEKGENNVF